MPIESVMPSSHLILCYPILLLPPITPSIRVFSNESTLLMRWPKCWSFSFSITPSNEHPGLISFRMDWLDLLAVQGTLKSLFQHHSSKASILRCSAFFTVQLSHPYMTTGKTIALTRQTFVDKLMSLIFNMLSRQIYFPTLSTKKKKKFCLCLSQNYQTIFLASQIAIFPVACQAPLSMGFSRQEYWRGFPFFPPGDLPDTGIEPTYLMSPALAGRFYTTRATWEGCFPQFLINCLMHYINKIMFFEERDIDMNA